MLAANIYSLSALLAFVSCAGYDSGYEENEKGRFVRSENTAAAPTSSEHLDSLQKETSIQPSDLLEELSQDAFKQGLLTALTRPDNSLRFVFLMHKYSLRIPPSSPINKYHYAFLANARIDAFTSTLDLLKDSSSSSLEHLPVFAAQVYEEMAIAYPEQALRALHRIGQQEHNRSIGEDYVKSITTYAKGGREPIGMAQLDESIARALANPQVLESLSNQQRGILQALKGGSETYHPLFCHIFQNYQFSNIQPKDELFFWESLIFSSMHSFARLYPTHAQEIAGSSVVPFDPFSKEPLKQDPIFSEGLECFTDLDQSVVWSASWGHTHTLALLVQKKAKHSYFSEGKALSDAAKNGHKDTVEFLLSRTEKPIGVERALEQAAENGYKYIVQIILPIVTMPYHVGVALQAASRGGHKGIVEILLEKEIYEKFVSGAVEGAAYYGHAEIVELLFRIATDKVSFDRALGVVASNGNRRIFNLLLPRVKNSDALGEALKNAAMKGHKKIVKRLLARVTDESHLGRALELAALGGNIRVFKLLLRRVTNPDNLSRAVVNAGQKGCKRILNVIFSRLTDPKPEHFAMALKNASSNGHNDLVEILMVHVKDQGHLGEALERAAKNGQKDTVKLLHPLVKELTHLRWALHLAIEHGHTEIVKILFGCDMNEYHLSHAVQSAARDGNNEILKLFLPQVKDQNELRWALKRAASQDHPETIELLLEYDMYPGHLGQALVDAAENGCKNAVEFLIPHITSLGYLEQALRGAVRNGKKEVVKILLPLFKNPEDLQHIPTSWFFDRNGECLALVREHIRSLQQP